MRGTYTIRSGDEVIKVGNMLTSYARFAILSYLAGESSAWASAVAVGAMDTPVTVDDARLGFEIGRGTVQFRLADYTNDSITVKASIPKGVVGEIRELGLYSSPNQTGRESDQMLLSDFNPESGNVEGVTAVTSRIGPYSSLVAGGITARFRDMGLDISALGNQDRFVLAYDSTDVTSVEFRLMNSTTDYLRYTFTPAAGYNSEAWAMGDFDVVGGGSTLRSFIEMQVIVTGAGGIVLDGLRADDTDVFEDQMLVSRAVLDAPLVKTNADEQEIEYSIQFNF